MINTTLKENTRPIEEDINTIPTISDSDLVKNIEKPESQSVAPLLSKQWNVAKSAINKKEDHRNLLQLGDIHLLKKNFGRASSIYKKATKLVPGFLPAYDKIIMCLLAQNKLIEADQYFQILIEKSNERPDIVHNYVLFKLFFMKNNDDEMDELIKYLKKIIIKNSEDPSVFNSLGFVYLNFKKDLANAKKFFNKALEVKSDYCHALNNLGVCHLRENKIPLAKDIFEKNINVNKGYKESYQNLASIFISQHKYLDVIKTLDKANSHSISIDNVWHHNYALSLLRSNKIDDAIKYYKDLIKKEPANNLLYNNIGHCYALKNNSDLAIKNFKESIEILKANASKGYDTRSLLAFYNLARVCILVNNDDYRLAERELERIAPDSPHNLLVKGMIAMKEEKYAEAKEFYTSVLEDKKAIFPEIYPDLSFLYSSIFEDFDTSIKLLKEAKKIGFGGSLIDNNLAYSYIKKGDLISAEEILSSYKNMDDPTLLATNGLLKIKKGHIESGVNNYNEAIKKANPESKHIFSQALYYELTLYYFEAGEKKKAKEYLVKANEIIFKSYYSGKIEKLVSQFL